MEKDKIAPFKVGQRVKVSPSATGLGEWITATVDNVELFAGRFFVSVTYDNDINGVKGMTMTNTALMESI